MSACHYVLATAGHVDHGKSALVKALTGIDPDRLPEEKARGITIDLGFAHLELEAPESNAGIDRFDLGLIDVPGHEDFVKNMVAGVGSIDLALFVVAADDGWMPQTEEHSQILHYLGVERAVVALTKIDLAEGRESTVVQSLREQLRDTPFANAPIVPTSVISGRGLEELKSALLRVLADTPAPRDFGKPRLPIDRVFTLHGIGTIVTGTLSGGTLRRGQTVLLQPSGNVARIRSLQTHNREVESASPGTRTALNLPDVSIRAKAHGSPGTDKISRGEVITLGELGAPSDTLNVLLEKSGRLLHLKIAAARPLKDGALVRFHHGSGNSAARVLLGQSMPLSPGQRVLAQLRFDSPLFVFAGDRFILRDWSEQTTLAGGVILDPDASRKTFRADAQRPFLHRRAEAPQSLETLAVTQLARDHAVRRTTFLLKSRFSAAEISDVINRLVNSGRAVVAGEFVADMTWWQSLRERVVEFIQAEHTARPERGGVALSDVRRALEEQVESSEVFNALLAELYRKELVQSGTNVRLVTHRPALPPHLRAVGAKLRALLAAKPFEPPSRKELAADSLSQQALRFLLETGEAVEVGEENILLAENFAKAKEAIRQFISARGAATASELRQALNTNRRVIIPLLERLDQDGITRRDGDRRMLR